MTMEHDQMILNFPALRPALAAQDPALLPVGLRFLAPGLDAAPDPDLYEVPAGLPLDPVRARKWLAEALAYGEQFKTPGELAALVLGSRVAFPAGSAASVRAKLLAMERPADPGDAAAASAHEARSRSQALLLLAHVMEERAIEIVGLDQGLTRSLAEFQESLGLVAEDSVPEDLEAPDLPAPAGESLYEEYGLPWNKVLEAFWTLAPEGAALFTADRSVAEAWLEEGQPFTVLTGEEAGRLYPRGLPAGVEILAARLAGPALLGRRARDKPWLESVRTVYAVAPGKA